MCGFGMRTPPHPLRKMEHKQLQTVRTPLRHTRNYLNIRAWNSSQNILTNYTRLLCSGYPRLPDSSFDLKTMPCQNTVKFAGRAPLPQMKKTDAIHCSSLILHVGCLPRRDKFCGLKVRQVRETN